MSPQRDRPLNDAECARMDAVLSRFGSEYAMSNREEIDGFLAALICSPDIAKPSEYLPEICGGEMAHDEAFIDREQLLDFLGLLMRHWDGIVRILHEEDAFAPLLVHGEGGVGHANDWALGFMRGVRLHYKSWKELFDDKEHSCLLFPILVLAHEHDADPEMRPSININVERREKLILDIAASVTAIYRYFALQRRRMEAGLVAAAKRTDGATFVDWTFTKKLM
jgi:uncharacterized protein